jgi:hypothetical protein
MSAREGYVVVITSIRENMISRTKGNKGKHVGGVGLRAVWKKRRWWTCGSFFLWSCFSVKRSGVDRLGGGGGEYNSKEKIFRHPCLRGISFQTKEGGGRVRQQEGEEGKPGFFVIPTYRGTSFRCVRIVGWKGVVLIGRVVHKTLVVVRRRRYFRCQA